MDASSPATPPASPKRRRNPIRMLLAFIAVAIMLIVLAVIRFNNFLHRRVSLDAIKFPVLILQPNGMAPFAAWQAIELEKFQEHSPDTPVENTILIDADFNLYQQRNVKQKTSDIGWLVRRYVLPTMRVTYTFDLYRVSKPNRDEAVKRLLACPTLTDNADLNPATLRDAIAAEPTLAGMTTLLRLYPPVEPLPTTDPATTDPAVIDATTAPATTNRPTDSPPTDPATTEPLPGL